MLKRYFTFIELFSNLLYVKLLLNALYKYKTHFQHYPSLRNL